MKKVINKKMYNTETAEEVARFSNGLGSTDFRSLKETLYKTKNGSWFLHGEGGAMTQYSEQCGDMSSAGEDIKVLTNEEAYEWLEAKEKTRAIEENFDITEA